MQVFKVHVYFLHLGFRVFEVKSTSGTTEQRWSPYVNSYTVKYHQHIDKNKTNQYSNDVNDDENQLSDFLPEQFSSLIHLTLESWVGSRAPTFPGAPGWRCDGGACDVTQQIALCWWGHKHDGCDEQLMEGRWVKSSIIYERWVITLPGWVCQEPPSVAHQEQDWMQGWYV